MRPIDADALKAGFEEDGHLSPYIEEFIDACPTVAIDCNSGCNWISVKDKPEPDEDGEYWCYGYWFGSGNKQCETAEYLGGMENSEQFYTHPLDAAARTAEGGMKMRDIVFCGLGFITGAIATVAFLYLIRVFPVEDIEKRIAELREAIERMEQPKENDDAS